MPDVCLNSWQTDPCESFLSYAWRSWDLVERGILVGLALMLAYTLFVLIRFCLLDPARGESPHFGTRPSFQFFPREKNLLADFSPAIGTIGGIASAAPLLGLAGTSYGILAALSSGYVGSKARFLAVISARLATAFPATLAAILVAVSAIVVHNFLRTRIEERGEDPCSTDNHTSSGEGSFQRAQTLPLRRRFSGLPQYAQLAAPTLACVVALFMPFHPYRIPTGLPVALQWCDHELGRPLPNRVVLLRISNSGKPFINMEPEDWANLRYLLGEIYRFREDRTLYVYAEDEVPFQTMADAIDIARNSPAPGLDSLDIKVILLLRTHPENVFQCLFESSP